MKTLSTEVLLTIARRLSESSLIVACNLLNERLDELDNMLADLSKPGTTGPVSTTPSAPAATYSGPGAAHSMTGVTLTPANRSPSPGGAHSMASVSMSPANGSYSASPVSYSGPGGGAHSMNTVTMTPANASQSTTSAPAGGAHSMSSVTMSPANGSYSASPANSGPGGASYSMNSVTMTPANGSGPVSYSGPGASASGGMHSMNSISYSSSGGGTPNSTGGQTYNFTPANASSGTPPPASFSGPGASFSGPGANFSGPGASFSGPGASFSGPGANFSGPGPAVSAGPGPSFSGPGANFSGPGPAMMSSGPGPSFSGPGPAMMSSGPGPSFSGPGPSMGPGANVTFASAGPGAAWAAQKKQDADEPIKLATKTPDGRDIIHKGPPCANCGEMIIGQCTNALGKTYHPEHFVCACCSQPFVGGKFMIKDNEPYCENDFYELFGNKCKTCGDPIKDKYVAASETLHFHPEHFVCDACGMRLAGKKFKVQDVSQDVLCIDCHVKRITVFGSGERICGKCLRPIAGEWIILKGQHMHAEHFRCEECGCAFVGGNCHEFEGALYCTEHYEKLLKKTCFKCRKPILGRGVSAVGRMFHPEHFCCFTCGEVLNSNSFFEKDGEAYCDNHYAMQFASVCEYCHKPILADGRSFLDKHYHAEHFKCSVCETLLKAGHIREWDQKPYCDKCYQKLPSEVRKKYEKKKLGEMKIEKRHEAEERRSAAKEEKTKKKEEKAAAKAKG